MRLAPSEENVQLLRQITQELERIKCQAGTDASNLLTRVSAEADELTRGDAESLEELLVKVAGDVRNLTETIQELIQETAVLADELEIQIHYSALAATSGQATGTMLTAGCPEQKVMAARARLQTAAGWLARKEINPKYQPNTPYASNCGSCSFALWQRLNGLNATASAGKKNIARTDADMERLTGLKCRYMQPNQIAAILRQRGPGSHLIVGINRNSYPGHWFNVFYDGKEIKTLDGQTGQVYDWPHDYGDVCDWCAML